MTSQTIAPAIIHKLVETFEQNLDSYRSSKNETELRVNFLKAGRVGYPPQVREGLERQIKVTDEAIDRLVYALYGLSEEEIRIVEG